MLVELMKKRAAAYDSFKALADKETLTAEEQTQYETLKRGVQDIDGQITRAREAQELAASTAQPVEGQMDGNGMLIRATVPAAAETSPYLNDSAARSLAEKNGFIAGSARSIVLGGMIQMVSAGGGNLRMAREEAKATYGESHPVTRALNVSAGASGGFIVPPDYMNEIIELLRPETVVRAAGGRVIPMPRGTMTLPGQASPATATYGSESKAIGASQQGLNQIVATYKKLTALVPVSNDMMRYADPAVDAFVRDDLVQVLALREDLAFLLGDGSQDTPRGFLSFAQGYSLTQGGVAGSFLTTGSSTAATKGNFITSTSNYTLATVAAELGGAVNKLDTANVRKRKRVWFMHPRSYNYLYNVQNSLGVYVYRDELNSGKLLGYPVSTTTQIGINYYDTGSNSDCSFVFLVEMSQDMILDSMSLELAVSREGSYVDANGTTQSAFQNDQTLIRAIAEHDHQLRHDQAVAVIQFVRWAPAIS